MFRKNLLMLIMVLMFLTTGTMLALASEGSDNFQVNSPIFIAGNELQPGAYKIKWESTSATEATVTFTIKGKVAAKVPGKYSELEQKNDRNSLMTGQDSTGRNALKQIQFAGKKVKITFE
jgi:hypothetical protein